MPSSPHADPTLRKLLPTVAEIANVGAFVASGPAAAMTGAIAVAPALERDSPDLVTPVTQTLGT